MASSGVGHHHLEKRRDIPAHHQNLVGAARLFGFQSLPAGCVQRVVGQDFTRELGGDDQLDCLIAEPSAGDENVRSLSLDETYFLRTRTFATATARNNCNINRGALKLSGTPHRFWSARQQAIIVNGQASLAPTMIPSKAPRSSRRFFGTKVLGPPGHDSPQHWIAKRKRKFAS